MYFKLTPVSLMALSLLIAPVVQAEESELKTLRAELGQMSKRIQELEKKSTQKTHHHSAAHHVHTPAHVDNVAFQAKIEERFKSLELQDSELKLASSNTVKSGSLPGSFLIPGSDTSIKIFGYVKVDGIYSSRAPGGDGSGGDASSNFVGVPLKGTPLYNQGEEFLTTARESRFGFDTETVSSKGTVGSRIEGDFYGSANVLRLRKAYIKYAAGNHEVLMGQEASNFGDGDATGNAELLDFGGIGGAPGGRIPMVRYAYSFNPKVKLITSFEEPDTEYQDSSQFVKSDGKDFALKNQNAASGDTVERFPDVVLHLRLGDDNAHMSFRGLASEQTFDNTTYRKREWGFGGAHSAHYTFVNKDVVAYDVTYGNVLTGWMSGGAGAIYDATNKNFFLQNILGVAASYKHMWSDTLRSTLGLGMMQIDNKGIAKTLQTNKVVRDLHINLIESPVKNLDIGMEYALGEREVEKAHAIPGYNVSNKGLTHRFQVSAKYKF
jgi:hypothetical protein